MRIRRLGTAALSLILVAVLLSGCDQGQKEAARVMTEYLNYLKDAQYDKAYAMLSDFDKGNITEDDFDKWQGLVAQIATTESFVIDGKADTFKDYEYLGTKFGTTYGLKVDRKQDVLVPEAELQGYDGATFRIMVQMDGGKGKVLLLLTNLDETIATYEAYLQ